MVTIYKVEKSDIEGEGKFLVEFRGLSDDDKPTSLNGGTIQNGSTYTEIDTGDKYMYDLENTTWYKVESGSGGSEPMEKFDYVIPAGLYEDVSGEITDEDIISVLKEIDDNYLDTDEKIKPLTIGIYLGNNEQSMEGYFSSCVQIGSAGGHVLLNFVSYVDYACMVMIYYSSGWKIVSSAI